MNRNLSPQEFEQVALPGMPPPYPQLPLLQQDKEHSRAPKFTEDSDWGAPNPIFSDETYDDYTYEMEPVGVDVNLRPVGAQTRREWVPTESLTSPQAEVSPVGVRDYAARETYPPPVPAVKFKGKHVVTDGNHRANANLARGRLITEADVFDLEHWRDTEGW